MKLLQCVLILLAILGLYYVYNGYTESFINMVSYATFPQSTNETILVDDYPSKAPQKLSSKTYQENAKMNPITPMSSYEQTTNNFKHWKTPDNGYCTTAEFCDALYNEKKVVDPKIPQPNSYETRVNYYNTSA